MSRQLQIHRIHRIDDAIIAIVGAMKRLESEWPILRAVPWSLSVFFFITLGSWQASPVDDVFHRPTTGHESLGGNEVSKRSAAEPSGDRLARRLNLSCTYVFQCVDALLVSWRLTVDGCWLLVSVVIREKDCGLVWSAYLRGRRLRTHHDECYPIARTTVRRDPSPFRSCLSAFSSHHAARHSSLPFSRLWRYSARMLAFPFPALALFHPPFRFWLLCLSCKWFCSRFTEKEWVVGSMVECNFGFINIGQGLDRIGREAMHTCEKLGIIRCLIH